MSTSKTAGWHVCEGKNDMDVDNSQIDGWFAGGVVPEVDPVDLESILQMCGGIQPAPGNREKATGEDLMAQVCRPGADVRAVGYRAAMLQLMGGPLDMLSPWLHDGILDKAVIKVAAKFPMEGMEIGVRRNGLPLDLGEFMKQVEAATRK
jgi:hypothetical protein